MQLDIPEGYEVTARTSLRDTYVTGVVDVHNKKRRKGFWRDVNHLYIPFTFEDIVKPAAFEDWQTDERSIYYMMLDNEYKDEDLPGFFIPISLRLNLALSYFRPRVQKSQEISDCLPEECSLTGTIFSYEHIEKIPLHIPRSQLSDQSVRQSLIAYEQANYVLRDAYEALRKKINIHKKTLRKWCLWTGIDPVPAKRRCPSSLSEIDKKTIHDAYVLVTTHVGSLAKWLGYRYDSVRKVLRELDLQPTERDRRKICPTKVKLITHLHKKGMAKAEIKRRLRTSNRMINQVVE